MKLVHYVIVQFFKHSPEAELIDLKQELEDVFNRKVSVPTTQRILKKLGWSWKIPTAFQIKKYTVDNMTRYLDYIRSIQQIDWDRIHFLDESHIVPRRLHKKRVFGLVNERTYITRNSLHSKTATITILTSVGPASETILLDYTEQQNDQWSILYIGLVLEDL